MNEPKVFLIHGFEGIPNGGWRSWLMGQLALEDVYACALPMPAPFEPKKDEWIAEIARVVGTPNDHTFLVGHSLGVPAILQYIQSLPDGSRLGGAVLVSGPFYNTKDEAETLLETFFHPEYDFDRIKKVCSNFAVIHGDNDPVVPFSDAEAFGKALGVQPVSIENGGHLNGSSGWRELPAALDYLISFIKPQ